MLRKRSRPVTGSGGSKISAADRSHNSAENNGNSLLPPLSQPPPPPSPSPPEKKSIKLLPASLFFFNSSKLFSNLFFTAESNSITETETPPPPQPSVMNHPPSSRFEANKTFFAPPPSPTSQLGGANSSILTDKQQQKPNPTKISSSTTTTTTKQHNHNHHHHFWDESNPEKGIGLVALIDETLNGSNNNYNATNPPPPYSSAASSKQQKTKLVVFGSQLKIQIPPSLPQFLPSNPSPTSSSSCCNSPGEFGIKTPRSNLFTNSRNGQQQNLDHDGLVRTPESISIEEIELSEDYTCVITRGPNPKTTRIFGNCILESCCGGGVNENGGGFCSKRNDDEEGFSNWSEKIPVVSPQREKKMEIESFLSFCHHCKKKIGEGNDIYMYRGEKAFCSQECRCQGMLFEEVEA